MHTLSLIPRGVRARVLGFLFGVGFKEVEVFFLDCKKDRMLRVQSDIPGTLLGDQDPTYQPPLDGKVVIIEQAEPLRLKVLTG